jgi:hypothetical protein
VTNGQRVPEDWHRLTANALVQLALRGGGSSAYKMDASDVSLVFSAPQVHGNPKLPTQPAAVNMGPVDAMVPAKPPAKARAKAKARATATSPVPTPTPEPANAGVLLAAQRA